MRRGTTPLYRFTLSVPAEQISKLRINFAQSGEVLLVKTEADCNYDGSAVSVSLTQEDTLKFREDYGIEIQIHILTTGKDSLRSNIMYDAVERCLGEEVLA